MYFTFSCFFKQSRISYQQLDIILALHHVFFLLNDANLFECFFPSEKISFVSFLSQRIHNKHFLHTLKFRAGRRCEFVRLAQIISDIRSSPVASQVSPRFLLTSLAALQHILTSR